MQSKTQMMMKGGMTMIRIEMVSVYGWEAALRGMRNPMNSWEKGDSCVSYSCECCDRKCSEYVSSGNACLHIGDNDHKLMKQLAKGGSVHAKYRRMITVTCDITAPLYWWKEFDTYKVGTVANSCSTMHKIHAKGFTEEDFSHEHLCYTSMCALRTIICALNASRDAFLLNKSKDDWWQMIQLLPSSYNQKRTVLMNYEVLVGMFRDRKNHKLDEWRVFCDWIKTLPCSEIITGEEGGETDEHS